jgi:hypothetical protein
MPLITLNQATNYLTAALVKAERLLTQSASAPHDLTLAEVYDALLKARRALASHRAQHLSHGQSPCATAHGLAAY